MLDDKIIEITNTIMEELHRGQFRNNRNEKGEKIPYIIHPRRVKENAIKIYRKTFGETDTLYLIETQVVALAHDLEDTSMSEEKFIWTLMTLSNDSDYSKFAAIRAALDIMNKFNHKNYLEYIQTAKTNPISRIVKLADLEDNLSDLKPGSLRDKYLLAQYILTN